MWAAAGGAASGPPGRSPETQEIDMTDVRRTGPPHRLDDPTRIGVPIAGEVDGIWQRAMQAQILEEIHQQPDLPDSEFFGKSLTINPDQVIFFFNAGAELLPRFLDMIEAAIPHANQVAKVERERLHAVEADAERELHDRDANMEQEISSWVEKRSALDASQAPSGGVLT
jgi:hypothetical protein